MNRICSTLFESGFRGAIISRDQWVDGRWSELDSILVRRHIKLSRRTESSVLEFSLTA